MAAVGDGTWWARGKESVRELSVSNILLGPYQARTSLDEDDLGELVESIRQYGVLQPVLVRPFGKGHELVAGERRLRACKIAGLKRIPAIVKRLSDQEAAVVGLVENLQRENLNCFEEAEGFQRVADEFGLTQQELARLVGKSQPAVANKLRLLRLDQAVRKAVTAGGLSERHARALLRVEDLAGQLRVVKEVTEKELTVRETEELVDNLLTGGGRKADKRKSDGRVVHVVKDVRLFLNSCRQAVRLLKRAGIDVEMDERDRAEELEVVVRIKKVYEEE